jgi:hypothetical protein
MTNKSPTTNLTERSVAATLWLRLRIWIANPPARCRMIEAAKQVAPADPREGQRFYRF